MKEKVKNVKQKGKGVLKEFKAFISKGNILDMAVGVVMASAFGAIVTALVNILMNLATAAIPGGLNGLVVALETQNAVKAATELGLPGLKLLAQDYLNLDASLKGFYTSYGGTYYFNQMPILNFGALITAIIDFIIIALVMFLIIKTVAMSKKKAEDLKKQALEEYYKLHPEERPVEPAPGAPAPTEVDVLMQIKALLEQQAKK